MTPLGKRILAGALIAAGGAFVWALIGFIGHADGSPLEFVALPAYAVLVTSWFVLPMGGILGAVMPRVVCDCSGRVAFIRGAVLGICAGIVAAILTTTFMAWSSLSGRATIVDRAAWERVVRDQFVSYLTTMMPVCAVWVGVWAYRWSLKIWANNFVKATPVFAILLILWHLPGAPY